MPRKREQGKSIQVHKSYWRKKTDNANHNISAEEHSPHKTTITHTKNNERFKIIKQHFKLNEIISSKYLEIQTTTKNSKTKN